MVVQNKTLRTTLDIAFEALFPEDGDLSVHPSNLSPAKTVENSPKTGKTNNPQVSLCRNGVDADESPAPYIKGQSLFGTFSRSSPSNVQPSTIFTNGADVDLEHWIHSFVETPAEKERAGKIFASMNYAPSDGLIVASVNLFARKKKRHFFLDGLYFCKVFAKEMDMTLSTFLRVRGWLVVNKNGVISISYRRIGDCLRLLGVEQAANYFRISAMFDRLFNILHSRKIFPVMPFEEQTSNKKKARSAITSRDNSPAQKKARLLTTTPRPASFDTTISDLMEGSIPSSFELPNHGRVELIEFHRKSSAFAKLLTYQQTLQLAMTAVNTCIGPMLPYQFSQDDSFMEKLFSVIFFNCGERRQMLEGTSFIGSPTLDFLYSSLSPSTFQVLRIF
jgi:hypothetical protein